MTLGKPTFEGWMRLVDIFLIDRIGLAHDDCEDWLWHDAFVDGAMPIHAVEEFLLDMGVN